VSEVFNAEAERIKHENIDKTLNEHTKLLEEHTKDITDLKEDGREYKIEIKNLIKKMDNFITVIMWGLGIFVTVSIFIIGVFLKN
jgi:DNA-binding transcriptional regulator GbsR (MarR family)